MKPLRINVSNLSIITMLLLIAIAPAFAQEEPQAPRFYKNLEASFGIRSTAVSSNYEQLNGEALLTEGGSIGLAFGSDAFITRLRGGFYYSAASVGTTIDVFETMLGGNAYPLAFTKHNKIRLQPYLSADLRYNQYKFAGDYLSSDPGPKNYSKANDVYIGKLHQMSACLGAGVEYRFINDLDFLALYFEGKFARPFNNRASIEDFKETSTSSPVVFNLGFRFGKSN